MMAEPAPKLAPPGAGIPTIERWVGNIIIKYFTLSPNIDVTWLKEEYPRSLQSLIALAKSFPEARRREQILIPRLRGLEDSSRYYSPTMVLEHIALVDRGIAGTVQILGRGEVPPYKVSTANVKPNPKTDWQSAMDMVNAASDQFMQSLSADFNSQVKLAHPWFGPLNAWQWAQFTVVHHKIHARQLEVMRNITV